MTGRAKALPAAGGALLVFLGLLGTLLPVVTAFSLPASLPLLLGAGALLTIYIVTMFSVRRLAWVLLLVLVAAWAFVCLRWQALLRVGAQVTIASVANELALGVNFISEIALPAGASAAEQAAGCTLFLVMLAAPVLLLYGWSIVYLSAAAPCVVVSLPFFAVTMVLMDKPPSLFSVLCTLAFWALLLLPQTTRRADPRRGVVLTLVYFPIVAALCAVVLLLSPRETYVRPAWPDVLREQLAELRSARQDGEGGDVPTLLETVERIDASRPDETVNVSGLGPRRTTGTAVLEILDEAGGTLYLRGSALGRYDGAAWRAPEDEPPTQAGGIAQATAAAAAAQGQARQIEIRHLSGETQLAYVPYYAVAGEGEIGESYARPLERTDAYGWTYVPLEAPAAAAEDAGELLYRAWAQEAYTALPEDLRGQLRVIAAAAGIDAAAPRETLVAQVAAYVRSAAVYDIETGRAPAGTDFILYFLIGSRRGYCVHFASAATAMLQALDVPARYVSGYLVRAEAGAWTTVTDDDAHAWVEVYLDGFGWVPVEVTGSTAPQELSPSPEPSPTAEPTTATAEPAAPTPELPGATDAPQATPGGAEETAAPGTTPGQPTPAGADVGMPPDGADGPGLPAGPGTGTARAALSPLWLLLLLVPAAAGALVLRRREALRRRAERLRRGDNAARILAAWRELQRLHRYGVRAPEALEQIALEARFSSHEMTDEQREQVFRFLERERTRLAKELPPLRRLVARYVLALL